MPDGLAQALAMPGLLPVLGIVIVAGLVYGFAGFGSALIFMPVAVAFLPPKIAIAAFQVSAFSSLFTVVPAAWKVADQRATLLMIAACLVTIPLGIWILKTTDVTPLRWAVLGVVSITLAALIMGWRLRRRPSTPLRVAVGAASGVLGGSVGLLGPVMILFNLSGGDRAEVVRANTLCFLTLSSVFLPVIMWLQGAMPPQALWLGLILLPLYAVATWAGKLLFNPAQEGLYRAVAYAIIAASIVMGLPIGD